MPTLSIDEIYAAARAAGFSEHQAVTWTGIALAESGGRTGASNTKGEHSIGLWQINLAADSGRAKYGDLTDPTNNARAAYDISHHGTDMRPWTTTHDLNKGTAADYRRYLPQVESEIGVTGDGRGVHGYGASLPPPLAPATGGSAASGSGTTGADAALAGSSYAMPTGRSLTSTAVLDEDTDHDGLTDAFEKLAGTNLKKADTDHDGLLDGYEARTSHTDPRTVDTDHDGVNDALELSTGTDPGTLPGTAGVVGTGIFAENSRVHHKDSDHDGLSDRIEKLLGTDTTNADTDGDGLNDALEASYGTNPLDADTDDDGLTDGIEHTYGTNPLTAGSGDQPTVAAWTMEAGAAAHAAATAQPPPGAAAAAGGSRTDALSTFLDEARAQAGDRYVYGAKLDTSKNNPTQFDCSSLTAWAADKAGVKLERTAEYQYMQLKGDGTTMSVDEAMHTPGALLFYFSEEPRSSLPAGQAHVAISLGDGRTIEAKGTRYGVGEWSAKGRFNYAAAIPGISDRAGQEAHRQAPASTQAADAADRADTVGSVGGADVSGGAAAMTGSSYAMPTGRSLTSTAVLDKDTDHDGLTDAFEKLAGTNLKKADTDHDGLLDGYEARTSHTDPRTVDTDHDGVNDALELSTGTDPGTLPGTAGVVGTGIFAENSRVHHKDSDHDGLSDRIEKLLGTDTTNADTDGDGLNDALEASYGTNPLDADTDDDGLTDGIEHTYGTNPLTPGSTLTPGSALGGDLGSDLGTGTGGPGLTDPSPVPADDPLGPNGDGGSHAGILGLD